MPAHFYQQCTAPTGETGSFLAKTAADGRTITELVSPVFPNTVHLFHWARDNGWKPMPGTFAREYARIPSDEQLYDLATHALDHARDHGYRPGGDDDDMLATGISEAATAADLELTADQEQRAVQILRGRLDELNESPTP